MFSYFGGEAKAEDNVVTGNVVDPELQGQTPSQVAVGESLPDGLAAIDEGEKQAILADISTNSYERGASEKWHFRTGFGPREFASRIAMCIIIWGIATFSKPKTPRGVEDKQWLIAFSLVMIIFFIVLHAFAYLPTMLYTSFSSMWGVVFGRLQTSYSNWRDYHYCAAIIVATILVYPFVFYFALLHDGFNPYSNLTYEQMKIEGGNTVQLVYILRMTLHLFMCVATIYMILMTFFLICIRRTQRYPGQRMWIIKKLAWLPYGTLFFEQGEYFDCGVCYRGIWRDSQVVRLTCHESHVFHRECLTDQVASFSNKFCVCCHASIKCLAPRTPIAPQVE